MADNYANFDVAVLLDFGRLGSFAFWLVVIWQRGEQQQGSVEKMLILADEKAAKG
jgi:hypothetical protein